MPARNLFEYAVIRIVPRVEREEFINAGVILFCPSQRFLQVRYEIDELRIRALFAQADIALIAENLASLQRISTGARDGGPIAALDLPSRFRWLTAMRSTVVQTSRPHPGLCHDAAEKLHQLFEELVA
jgi:hypothetical protein